MIFQVNFIILIILTIMLIIILTVITMMMTIIWGWIFNLCFCFFIDRNLTIYIFLFDCCRFLSDIRIYASMLLVFVFFIWVLVFNRLSHEILIYVDNLFKINIDPFFPVFIFFCIFFYFYLLFGSNDFYDFTICTMIMVIFVIF